MLWKADIKIESIKERKREREREKEKERKMQRKKERKKERNVKRMTVSLLKFPEFFSVLGLLLFIRFI